MKLCDFLSHEFIKQDKAIFRTRGVIVNLSYDRYLKKYCTRLDYKSCLVPVRCEYNLLPPSLLKVCERVFRRKFKRRKVSREGYAHL